MTVSSRRNSGLCLLLCGTSACQVVLGLSEHQLGSLEGTAGAAGASQVASDGIAGSAGSSAIGADGGCVRGAFEFCDDFTDSNLDQWMAVDQDPAWRGSWSVSTQTNAAGESSNAASQTATVRGYHYLVGPQTVNGPFGDQLVTAWVRPDALPGDDNTKVGICVRFSGKTNDDLSGYCLFLRNDSAVAGRVQISKKLAGGSMNSLGAALLPLSTFQIGVWYKVALSCTGKTVATIKGFINDEHWVSITDDSSPVEAGQAALVTRTASESSAPGLATFDDVTLESL